MGQAGIDNADDIFTHKEETRRPELPETSSQEGLLYPKHKFYAYSNFSKVHVISQLSLQRKWVGVIVIVE